MVHSGAAVEHGWATGVKQNRRQRIQSVIQKLTYLFRACIRRRLFGPGWYFQDGPQVAVMS